MRSKRNLIAGAAATFVALVLVPSQAVAIPAFSVSASKHRSGPFEAGVQSVTIDPGKTKDLYWKVTSNGGNPPPFELKFDDASTPHPNPDGFKIKWFRQNKNITSEVKGSGYEFKLGSEHKVFRARVRAVGPGEFCLGGQASFRTGKPFFDAAYFGVNGKTCA